MPESLDLVIFVLLTTDKSDCFSPCACRQCNNQYYPCYTVAMYTRLPQLEHYLDTITNINTALSDYQKSRQRSYYKSIVVWYYSHSHSKLP